jgi:TusA-related sulfurtransferase
MSAETLPIDAQVDITDVVCPSTVVNTKIALEKLEEGQVLEIKLNDGEPIQNIPRSLKEEGHKVVKVTKLDDRAWLLWVVKGGLRSWHPAI